MGELPVLVGAFAVSLRFSRPDIDAGLIGLDLELSGFSGRGCEGGGAGGSAKRVR